MVDAQQAAAPIVYSAPKRGQNFRKTSEVHELEFLLPVRFGIEVEGINLGKRVTPFDEV